MNSGAVPPILNATGRGVLGSRGCWGVGSRMTILRDDDIPGYRDTGIPGYRYIVISEIRNTVIS